MEILRTLSFFLCGYFFVYSVANHHWLAAVVMIIAVFWTFDASLAHARISRMAANRTTIPADHDQKTTVSRSQESKDPDHHPSFWDTLHDYFSV